MIRGLYKLADRTFAKEGEIPAEVSEILLEGEEVFACYESGNDSVVFTDRRFISKDTRINKTTLYSVPYKAVNVWSSEGAGNMDINTEITFWTNNEQVRINLGKDADIRAIDKFVSEKVMA